METIKIYLINFITLGVSFTSISETLKILLLLVTIGYTLQRWYFLNNKK